MRTSRIMSSFRLMALLALLAGTGVAGAQEWSAGVTYTYDAAGNIIGIGADVHEYDGVGRLTGSDTNGVRRDFVYDGFGNRIGCSQAPGSVCQSYAITSATNRMAAPAQYDASGNVTYLEQHAYAYDAFDMQIRDETNAGSVVIAREYLYTADAERLAVHTVNNGRWQWTLRDLSGKVLREVTSTDSATAGAPEGSANWAWSKDYVYREGLLLATRQPEAGTATPTTYHYHLDHLGTPRRITDDENRIVGQHTYHAFGPELSAGRIDEPSITRVKYTGHERDGDLDYMHARYYSAGLGRFLSVDPTWESADLGKPQSWNRYSYVLNNPVNAIDPDGRLGFLTNDPEKLRERNEKIIGYTSKAIAVVVLDAKSTGASAELPQRAKDIHGALKPVTQKRTTAATATVTNADGTTQVLVASSEKNLRPAQRAAMRAGETAVSGAGHAEQTIINAAAANGQTVEAIAASRPICPSCAAAIKKVGAEAVSVLKRIATLVF